MKDNGISLRECNGLKFKFPLLSNDNDRRVKSSIPLVDQIG
jgi:hypothetical protein